MFKIQDELNFVFFQKLMMPIKLIFAQISHLQIWKLSATVMVVSHHW